MSADGPTDDTVTEQTAVLWPGYFAKPATAPAWPPAMRVSVAANTQTLGSMLEHLATGFAESLSDISVPVTFVLGEHSPMPIIEGEQAACLISSAQVRIVLAAGHLPWVEHPGCIAESLAILHAATAGQDAPSTRKAGPSGEAR